MTRRPTALALLGLLALGAGPGSGSDEAFFREKIAPVLERRCVSCHGDAVAKGGLSLASRAAALKGGGGGPAVAPGTPDESLLLDAVVGDPPEMPKKGTPLAAAQVADLRTWIGRGAAWPEGVTLRDRKFEGEAWWAFTPLERPKVPAAASKGWVRTPIDAFVVQRLEKEGLRPSAEADRRTLIRRLTYDLHGLPPTPGEVEAFLGDERPDAYERLVDRLLASPRYGERWGRHWLDVVHYGDTHGYDKDKRRDHAWPYRDFVIRALNDDMPYGGFAARQIAGDVLEPGDPDGAVAAGFVAAGPWDFVGHVELREGTVDKEKARLNDRDDMLANAMSTFQSMTAHCARCHDHKFDPIPQVDYYRLQAVFAGVERGDRAYPSREAEASRRELAARRAGLVARLGAIDARVAALTSPELERLSGLVDALRDQIAATPRAAPSGPTPSPTNGYHSAIHAGAEATAWVQVDLGASRPLDEIRVVPARPTDFADTPGFGFPTRFKVEVSDDPTFAASAVVEEVRRPDRPDVEDEAFVVRPGGRPGRYVRVSASRLWERTKDYVFALGELEVIAGGLNVARGRPVSALDSIEGGRWSRAALVDGFDSRGERPAVLDPNAARRAELSYRRRRAEGERRKLAEALIPSALRAEREGVVAEIAGVDGAMAKVAAGSRVYTVVPREPRAIRLLKRGEVEQPGQEIGPGALSCVPGLDFDFSAGAGGAEGGRRAALARWIASEKNVLTWRSIANRVWHFHFGRGLVDTPGDFGRNGSRPTHPELLDWLAVEMRENGQSLKALHRLIVTSAVYRQASAGSKAGGAKDADNRWLWRQNPRRLEAEAVRDATLAITGTLDGRMGGPGFDLFKFKDDHSPVYDHVAPGVADNPSVRRRTVYRFIVRSVPNPFLESLDCADPSINTPVRTTTITALQALALWNDAFVASQSRAFAARLGEGAEMGPKIERAYRLALSRPPTDAERTAMAAYAGKFGLAAACRVLLNTNEFMFVD